MRRAVLIGLGMVALAGCGKNTYGTSVPYRPDAPEPIEVAMPAEALAISQQFWDTQDPGNLGHEGIDIVGEPGTPILAAAPGRVIDSYYEPLYGNRIHIDHGPDADGVPVVTRYFHMSARLKRPGDVVARGEQIGTMGSTGLLGLANHLHFEVRRRERRSLGRPYDPHLFWVDGPGRVTCFDPDRSYPEDRFGITYPTPCRAPAGGPG